MPLRYGDIEWNNEPVVWYIVSRNIELTPGNKVEKVDLYPADEEVQEMCDEVKDEVSRKIKKTLKKLHAETFAAKVAHEGIHFYIKASISNQECVHLRIHRPFSYRGEKPTLEAVLANQGKQKPINYF